MKQYNILTKVTGLLSRAGFQIQKHSPEILVVVGVVGTVASAVIACRATTKISGILQGPKEDIRQIHDLMANETMAEANEYTKKDGVKDLTVVYIQTGLKVAALYAPAVILGVASLTCILTSHNILQKRNFALATAYAAIDKGFKEYRNRVVERFGKDVDHQLKFNIKEQNVTKESVDPETGEITTTDEVAKVVDCAGCSPYARFFDETSVYWEKAAYYNLQFVTQHENYANDILRAKGHLFLNDVYKALGLQPSKAGQVVGWVYIPGKDNRVSFGIQEIYKAMADGIIDPKRTILLDFNVDGPILNVAGLEE